MKSRARAERRAGSRPETGLRRAVLLSSAGHLLALAACVLLGPGLPAPSVPAVEVVLVEPAVRGGTGSAPEPRRIGPGGEATRLDRRKAAPPRRRERRSDPGRSVPPDRTAGPALPEENPPRTESAVERGFAGEVRYPEGGPTPAMVRPTGAGAAETAEVRADPGDRPGNRSAGSRGKVGEPTAKADGAVSAAATPWDDPRGGGAVGGGDGVAAARLRAAIQSRIVYPAEAVRRGLEGEVLLRIRIGTGGSPGEIRVAKSSGARILDEAARRGVVRAAPLPSAPGWVEVPVRFLLRRPAGDMP